MILTRGRSGVRTASIAIALVSLVAFSGVSAARAGVPRCMGRPATHVGTSGPDVLVGTAQADVFVGLGGDDRSIGRGGNDVFCGGGGGDMFKGGAGDDQGTGQGGDDSLLGGAGDDTLIGAQGDDELNGGRGNDDLDGGAGTDGCVNGESLSRCETPPEEFDVDGAWSGTTSQGKDILFDVADHALTEITISYGWSGPGCTSESSTTITFATPLEITENSFDIDSNPGTLSLQVHGEFTSDTAAYGTFSASDTGGFCPGSATGTWTAAKA